jgi:predicted polyphosphate/ATP-dependent NAD kinase|tara:strand:- start:264 stop:1232 length:969 start_codon:yes stop_codon:yes gene_type:complete
VTATVGVIANPVAGKDIRRLVSAASPVSDMAKIGIIRRAVVGAVEGGAQRLLITDDRRALGLRAIDGLSLDAEVAFLDAPPYDSGVNSQNAAAIFRDRGVGAVIVLGGDGTHRDVAKGWRTAPVVAVSTGTNNVFPRQVEATIAGQAAGVVASQQPPIHKVANQAKIIDVELDHGEAEQALVDIALVDESFTGSRAVWKGQSLLEMVAAIAERATVGLSSIASRVAPTTRHQPGGVHVTFGDGERFRVPIAPGLFSEVEIASWRRLRANDFVEMSGPGVLSFDGERDLVLASGRSALVTVSHDGLWVIDIEKVMSLECGEAC